MPLGLDLIDDEDSSTKFIGCLSKANPSDCTTLSGIAEVDIVPFIPWLDIRNNKGDFLLVL